MFFKNKVCVLGHKKISFVDAVINSHSTGYSEYIDSTFRKIRELSVGDIRCTSVEFVTGFTPSVIKKIRTYTEYKKNPEAFAISIGKKTVVWAAAPEGFIYAAVTLLSLAETDELAEGFIYDYPCDDIRGYRTFLPPRDRFDDFREMVDFLAYYKYNCLMLEVGGAMEYKRHPEINETWVKLCEDINAYSGRGNEIQRSFGWSKNSFHCDNAGGGYLTQDEVRELVAYCRSRGIDVIPECPTFSHCDYLVMAHPEIAERSNDPYPDSYCPNHPDTYTYVFDILEEVIEVFRPKAINIGHDEAYSVSICPKCKNTPAPKGYADDVWKIRNFLAEKGVHVYMWGEKLLKSYTNDGHPVGGTGTKGWSPRLYPCRDLLPRDITFMHWYWPFNPKYDDVYHDRNMDVVYGNVSAKSVREWDSRRKRGIHGGFVGNWGSCEEEYMQRNLQYFDLVTTAYAFWCDDFEAMGSEAQLDIAAKELYRLKNLKIKHPITVVHATSHKIPFELFYDGVFITDEKYVLGNYELTYADGMTALLPVKYGTNISTDTFENYTTDNAFREVTYSTLPRMANGRFVYECTYENPKPGVPVVAFRYVPVEAMKDVAVDVLAVSFTPTVTGISKQQTRQSSGGDFGFKIYD
ncbi:MAG: family 20 glycosylhydrolase [Clostridia bacterium]|nr:family 20 glycosylhydrolase [Clostridia bacterium]